MNAAAPDVVPNRFLTSTTGIPWLDDVMASMPPPVSLEGDGELARGRTLCIMGSPGTGKTMLAMQLLVATTGRNRPGLMLLGEETLSVAVERMNDLRTVQEIREAQLARDLIEGQARVSAADYIDILSSRDDADRVLSILRTLKASVVVLDMTHRCVVRDEPKNSYQGFVERCRSAVDRTTTLIFTGNCSSRPGDEVVLLEQVSDSVLLLHTREVVNGAVRVRLSSKKHRFLPTPKGFAQLEVSHQVVTRCEGGVTRCEGGVRSVLESRSLVQVIE